MITSPKTKRTNTSSQFQTNQRPMVVRAPGFLHRTRWFCTFLSFVVISISNNETHGATMTFTDQATFLAQLNSFNVEDFESTAVGTPIPNGASVGSITFNHTIDDGFGGTLDTIVTDQFDTTSGDRYLGVDDGVDEVFLDGDNFSMSFSSTQAIGLYVIGSPADVVAGDFSLAAGGETIFNSDTPDITLADGGEAFFLGIIEDDLAQPFSGADLATIGGGFFVYTVDDIITSSDLKSGGDQPIPEPSTVALMGLGVVGLFIGLKRRQREEN